MYVTRYNKIILPIFYLIDIFSLLYIYIISYNKLFFEFDFFSSDHSHAFFIITSSLVLSIFFKTVIVRRLITIGNYIINLIFILSINIIITVIFLFLFNYDNEYILLFRNFIIYSSLYILSINLIRYFYITHYRSKGYNIIYSAVIAPEKFSDLDNLKSELNLIGYDIVQEFKGNRKNELEKINKVLNKNIFSTIFLIHPNEYSFNIDHLINKCDNNNIRVKLLPNYSNYLNKRTGADIVAGHAIIDVRNEPLAFLHNRILKRSIDIILSLLSIIFVLSILPIIIKVFQLFFDRGPLFFKQQRIGKNGDTFTIYKFRTLKEDIFIEKSNVIGGFDESTHKNDFNKRLTRFGRILRKTNLDEYPQFINVLLGDMSVVGPRPILISSDYHLSKRIPKYSVRKFIKPGVTGWAQVNGYRGSIENNENMKKRTELDLYYLENWTIFFDIKIILLTVYQMATFSIPNAD